MWPREYMYIALTYVVSNYVFLCTVWLVSLGRYLLNRCDAYSETLERNS